MIYKSNEKAGKQSKRPRIGVYAGAFDPVHAGHIAFALQAIQAAELDEVVFMPERRPRTKPGVAHYAHRIAMLKTALRPHPKLAVMEVVDRNFTVRRTWPLLQTTFPDATLVFLMGSDVVRSFPSWPYAGRLMADSEFVVAVRGAQAESEVRKDIATWNPALERVKIVDSYAPDVSSSKVRSAIGEDRSVAGLLVSVQRYARREWLYVSPGNYAR